MSATVLQRPPPKLEEPIIIDDSDSQLSEPDSGPSSNLTPPPALAPIFLKKKSTISLSTGATSSIKKSNAAAPVKKEKAKPVKRKAEDEPKKPKAAKKVKAEKAKADSDVEIDLAELDKLIPATRMVPETLEEDWQVPYIYAFIRKFEIDIKGLFTIDDLETGLRANQPDEVLSEVFMVFLKNLEKSGSPRLVKDNLPSFLTNFLNSRLALKAPATVWDPYDWSPYVKGFLVKPFEKFMAERENPGFSIINGLENGNRLSEVNLVGNGSKGKGKAEAGGGDVDGDVDMEGSDDSPLTAESSYKGQRSELNQARDARLALNPLREKGLWELSWYEKATLLRQLVEWQLVECEKIKDKIDEHYPKKVPRKPNVLDTEAIERTSDGLRIWTFEPTYRLYTQTNPHQFSGKWAVKTDNKEEYEALLAELKKKVDTIPAKEERREKLKGAKRKAVVKELLGLKREMKIVEALELAGPAIVQFDLDTKEKREKYEVARVRQRKNQERRSRMENAPPSNILTGLRSRKQVNYGEQNDDNEESEEDLMIPYQGRAGQTDSADNSPSGSSGRRDAPVINSRRQSSSNNSRQSYKAEESDSDFEADAADADVITSEDEQILVSAGQNGNGAGAAGGVVKKSKRVDSDDEDEDEAEAIESEAESAYDDDQE